MNQIGLGLAAIGFSLLGCTQNGDTPEVATGDSVMLASFKLSNGNSLTLTGLADGDGEIFVSETTPAGSGERFVVDEFPGASPLELFARLSPESAAVPAMIADSATDQDLAAWMGQRTVADSPSAGTFRLDISKVGWLPLPATAAPGNGSCDPQTGAQYFDEHHCYTSGPYGYGHSEEHCDNAKVFGSLQRTSVDKMRHTYTRSAACDGTGVIRHFRVDGSDWLEVLNEQIEPNTVATYTSYRKGGLKKDRRVRVAPLDDFDTDAYVRNWVKYYDQVTDNAP